MLPPWLSKQTWPEVAGGIAFHLPMHVTLIALFERNPGHVDYLGFAYETERRTSMFDPIGPYIIRAAITHPDLNGQPLIAAIARRINQGGVLTIVSAWGDKQAPTVKSFWWPSLSSPNPQPFDDFQLFGINEFGTAVGMFETDTRAGLLVLNSPPTDLPVIGSTVAYDINNAGVICGCPTDPGGTGFFLIPNGDGTYQSILASDASGEPIDFRPVAINNFGIAAGTATDALGTQQAAFAVVDTSAMTAIATFLSNDPRGGTAAEINDRGMVCGTVPNDGVNSLPGIWDTTVADPSASFTSIPLPQDFTTGVALGINTNGEVVGQCHKPDGTVTAFYSDGQNGYDLNKFVRRAEWTLLEANCINDIGQIGGRGVFAPTSGGGFGDDPITTAFLLHPQPHQ